NDKFVIYSITKVFSAIAIGILIDKKLIQSPEVPIATYFEAWKSDTLKSKVKIRHILQHTSGIASNKGSQDIYSQTDFVQFALNSPVITEPGLTHFYNNKAINIISGVVKKVTGQTLAQFIKENVFKPLAITDYEWKHDNAGNTWGMDGLWLNANDLMKIGQLLCNFGEWNGKRILSKRWCEFMFQMPLVNAMNGLYGYAMSIRALPFLEEIAITSTTIDTLNQLGLPNDKTEKLKSLQNKEVYKYLELGERLKQLFSHQEMEEITSFASQHLIPLYTITNGSYFIKHGGEYGLLMTAFPKKKKVVIRYLGEKWGRKTNKDGAYKYFIEDEIVNYMLRL
nr:beta-lactamase family protein [Thermoflexibacter sp.]